ncbi:MAG: NFACT family protein, partial [Oscillospiraceae bacterium]|nr:NFACT family protein [Oscillospiraceae bacterium]
AIGQYGTGMETERCGSFSALLDAFYGRREKALRMQRRAQDLTRTVKTALDRLTRKLALQREELRRTGERETFRRRGDLITANMWRLEKGARVLECEDYYQDECPTVEIPLDPLKTPQQNAAKYYKEYNKLKAAETHLTAQIEKGEKELDYLYSVLDLLSRAESEKDLSEFRRELTETGYLRAQKQKKKEKPVTTKPLRFLSGAGLEIAVGRNNAQNDHLTLRDARRTDYWFHTQKIHGSHVILRCGDAQPDEQSVHEAALLAAWYSQGRMSGKVAVDYTMVRFVRKPAGALPGKVIYTDYRTLFVEPTEVQIEALRRLS